MVATKISAIVFVYQHADVVLNALNSLDGKVDEILCFDGRWHGYTGPDHSNDGTKELITEFAKTHEKVKYIELPVAHQNEARTMALDYVQTGDWIFFLDADEILFEVDEYLHNILEESKVNQYRVCMEFYRNFSAMPTARLLKKREGLKFTTDHRRMFDKSGEIDFIHAPIIHMVIKHHLSKEKKMRKQADAYKKWLLDWETHIQEH